jgi:hypothetical protein
MGERGFARTGSLTGPNDVSPVGQMSPMCLRHPSVVSALPDLDP